MVWSFTWIVLMTLRISLISVTSSFMSLSRSSTLFISLETNILNSNGSNWKYQTYFSFSCFNSLFLSESCDFHSARFLTFSFSSFSSLCKASTIFPDSSDFLDWVADFWLFSNHWCSVFKPESSLFSCFSLSWVWKSFFFKSFWKTRMICDDICVVFDDVGS